MLIHKYILSPMISHGITDLVECPRKTLISYALINPIVLNLNIEQQTILLISSSIYHMRKDVPGGLLGSSIMHNIWLYEPLVAQFYLSFVHTPRHYCRSLKTKPIPKVFLIACMSILSLIALNQSWNIYLINKFGILWWSAPVISHIFVNELFVKD
jgi:hypothetical protein